jgi:acetoacetate decarboxylase
MEKFTVKCGNNMPIQSPLIPDPLVPYECKNNRTLFAVCKGGKNQIDRYLVPTPFESVSELFVVSISDFTNCKKLPFMDCGIIFPVKYKNIIGGYYMFEYENDDSAIAAGRELWGYPKKFASISLSENEKIITGTVIRKGVKIVEVRCDFSKTVDDVPKLKITPHLNIHSIPNADGPGTFSKRIISRDTSPDFKLISEKYGMSEVQLNGIPTDPLNELEPQEVLGGGLMVGDYLASEKNGWGNVIDILI